MELLILWVAASAGVAYAATMRGRSGAGWLLLAVLVSPLLAVLLLLACPMKAKAVRVPAKPLLQPAARRRAGYIACFALGGFLSLSALSVWALWGILAYAGKAQGDGFMVVAGLIETGIAAVLVAYGVAQKREPLRLAMTPEVRSSVLGSLPDAALR